MFKPARLLEHPIVLYLPGLFSFRVFSRFGWKIATGRSLLQKIAAI